MRIRVKFAKRGSLKYIGHLDVMRFFQKAVRRAGLDVVYSEGFSPHMLMSFAQPLGVGITSEAEYFDLDLKSAQSSSEMKRLLNEQMPEEMEVLEIVQIPEDKASKCMTLVAAAGYEISFEGVDMPLFIEQFESFMNEDEINIVKKTKKSETLTNIKPLIYGYSFTDNGVKLMLSAGSVNNLKPQLLLDAFFGCFGAEFSALKRSIQRSELYALKEEEAVPLYKLGEEIA